jgi:diguanylate cyclase (GGDEF)-like protein
VTPALAARVGRSLFRGLHVRLILLVLLAIMPAVALLVYADLKERQIVLLDIEASASRMVRLAASSHDRLVAGARDLLPALAQLAELHGADPKTCASLFATLLRQFPHYANLGAIRPNGDLFCSGHPTSGSVNLGDRSFFREARRTRRLSFGHYAVDHITGRATLTLAYPAFDAAGRLTSVVFAAVDIAWLHQLAADAQLPEGSVLMVLDHSGTILVRHPDPERVVGQSLPDAPLVKAILARGDGVAEVPGMDALPRVYAFTRLPSAPTNSVFVTVGLSKEAAFANASRVLSRNLFLLALVAVLGLVATRLYGTRFIVRPMSALAAAAERLSAGDLGARADVRSGDEFGRLGQAFNAMAERLQGIVEREQQRTRELAQRKELSKLLEACATLKEASLVLDRVMGQLLGGRRGTVFLMTPSNFVEVLASWGTPPAAGRGAFTPDECWALRRGRPHVVESVESDVRCGHVDATATAAYLCLPLVAQGEALGILHLAADDASTRLDGDAARLAAAVAEDLGISLAGLKLRETLRNQSIRDHVTGLFNRRYMEETLNRELRRAERTRRPVTVVMLDIDYFKRFNDTYGHGVGDALLRELGRLLRAGLRAGDVPCRYGGDEFAIILPEASVEDVVKRADQLREAAKRLQVRHLGGSVGSVTLSLGAAAFPEHGATAEALLKAADMALYRAKQEGRDRLVVLEPTT